MKKLSEMTLEELWQLFPIILAEHRAEWAEWFRAEAAFLAELLPEAAIAHIGSTAIRDIWPSRLWISLWKPGKRPTGRRLPAC